MKNPLTVTLLAILSVVVLCGVIIFALAISYRNQEVSLRNQATAQQKANEVIYDKVWKVISQKAQIAEKYKDSFKDIYVKIMQERYEGDKKQAPLFKWIQEQNPNFSVDLYASLGDAVEGNRAEFAQVQKRLLDIKREHQDLRMKFPGSLFVGSRPELQINIVTSTETERVFAVGKEDNVELFK
jgi:hypothetical protein